MKLIKLSLYFDLYICSIFSVMRNILKFKLLLSDFFNYLIFIKL